ncbi:hypothetical protein IFR05_009431 [Cadophora sp. M221]|nr:hypothetical protein IFR05_009431 [Cadophora sp. M221]
MKLCAIISTLLMALVFLATEVIANPASSADLVSLTGPFDGLPFPMDIQEHNYLLKECPVEEMETWFNTTMAEYSNSALSKCGKVSIISILL